MIRKILLVTIISAIALWLAGAHFIKSKLTSEIQGLASENIKLSYGDTSISGFPFSWKVKILSPKITVTDQALVRDITMNEINFKFGFFLRSADINFGKLIYINEIKHEITQEYKILADNDITLDMSLNGTSYAISKWKQNITTAQSILPNLTCFLDHREIFNLSGIKVLASQDDTNSLNKIKVIFLGDYNSASSYFHTKNAHLAFDLQYFINNATLNNDTKLGFDHKLEIADFVLKLDDASIDFSGFLDLSRNNAPSGEIDLSVMQYRNIIDTLVPEDFILSRSYIKKIIARVNSVKDTDNIDVKINFSEKGIFLDSLNLMELNQISN